MNFVNGGGGNGARHPNTFNNTLSFTHNSINSLNNPNLVFHDFSLTPSYAKNKKYNIENFFDALGIVQEEHLIARGNYTKAKIVSGRFVHSGEPLALKMINLRYAPDNMMKHAKEECEAVKGLDHSGVCKTFHFFTFENTIYIVMNYPGSVTLSEHIRRYSSLPLEIVTALTCELVCAVGYLHSKLIAHRDIKPDNIIIRNPRDSELSEIVLVDFGFSKKLKERTQNCDVFCGTRAYKAPEIRSAVPYNPFQSDIWSMGVVVCKMFTSKTIFSGLSNSEVTTIVTGSLMKFLTQNYPDRPLPSDAFSVISKMLAHTPTSRMKLHEIICSKWIHKSSRCREIINRPENANFVLSFPFV